MVEALTVEDAYRPYRLSQDFPAEELYGQFVLTQQLEDIPKGWKIEKHGAWLLGVCPTLPHVRIAAPDEKAVCLLVGYPVAEDARVLGVEAINNWPNDQDLAGFEDWLYRHGGRYVAVYLGPDLERVYLDASGSLAVVYSPVAEVTASTNMLIPYVSGTSDNDPLIDLLGIPHRNNYYTFGLTPRHNVRRLLPNHYLDLKKYQAVRHWPKGEIEFNRAPAQCVVEIHEILANTIRAYAHRYGGVQLSCTAGCDSRVLLAAAMSCREKVHSFTFELKPALTKADVATGSAIAHAAGVSHRVHAAQEASFEDLRRWLWRNGGSAHAMVGWRNQHAFYALDPNYPYLPGMLGEVSRPFIYERHGKVFASRDLHHLLNFWRLPVGDEVIEHAQAWLDKLPVNNGMSVFALHYIENRIGCWAGPVLYSQFGAGAFTAFPFNHRRIIELMLSLPPEYRLK
jgi:hypothetical protein